MERLLAKLDARTVETVDDDRVQSILRAHGTRRELRRGGLRGRRKQKELVVFRHLTDEELYPGRSWRHLRNGQQEYQDNQVLCHTAVEIQSTIGCPFDCTYCPYSSFICCTLDIETFVERATQLALEQPHQFVFKLNNRTDTLGLEPEYGLAPLLVERFANLPNKYLMLYTKGDHTDSIERLDHRGKTIAAFTLTPERIASMLEISAPSTSRRLKAIERLYQVGYPIRVRYSPIVPIRGWRQAYRDLTSQLMRVARPELLTLWTLSMIDLQELTAIVPVEELDEQALIAARDAARQMNGQKGAPFPPWFRAELYREIAGHIKDISPSTRVSLCLETPETWDSVAPFTVPRRGRSFVCNCAPRAVPFNTAGKKQKLDS
jgi:DNA repair photolyase